MSSKRKHDCSSLIKQQVESGDSVVKFCRDNNLNSQSFYNNRTKLSTKAVTAGFVKIQRKTVINEHLTLAVGEATLDIPNNVDAKWLASLLRELA